MGKDLAPTMKHVWLPAKVLMYNLGGKCACLAFEQSVCAIMGCLSIDSFVLFAA